MGFPSSSRAAGAVPAFRAASRSFCLRKSSRDTLPTAIEQPNIRLSHCWSGGTYTLAEAIMVVDYMYRTERLFQIR